MPAATATEWLTAISIGTGAFLPGALLILSLDHDMLRLPRVDAGAARETAEQAMQAAGLRAAAWLLVLAWHLGQKEATR